MRSVSLTLLTFCSNSGLILREGFSVMLVGKNLFDERKNYTRCDKCRFNKGPCPHCKKRIKELREKWDFNGPTTKEIIRQGLRANRKLFFQKQKDLSRQGLGTSPYEGQTGFVERIKRKQERMKEGLTQEQLAFKKSLCKRRISSKK